MKRLARHLFTPCSAVSLLLCVVVCVLWVRSYFVSEHAIWARVQISGGIKSYSCVGVHVVKGGFMAGAGSASGRRGLGPHWLWFRDRQSRVGTGWHLLSHEKDDSSAENWTPQIWGFGYIANDRAPMAEGGLQYRHMVTVPFWFLFTLSILLPAKWLLDKLLLPRRRRMAGLCPTCSYDLRASPERCPECGAVDTALGGNA